MKVIDFEPEIKLAPEAILKQAIKDSKDYNKCIVVLFDGEYPTIRWSPDITVGEVIGQLFSCCVGLLVDNEDD